MTLHSRSRNQINLRYTPEISNSMFLYGVRKSGQAVLFPGFILNFPSIMTEKIYRRHSISSAESRFGTLERRLNNQMTLHSRSRNQINLRYTPEILNSMFLHEVRKSGQAVLFPGFIFCNTNKSRVIFSRVINRIKTFFVLFACRF
jgi:hypothetical protein